MTYTRTQMVVLTIIAATAIGLVVATILNTDVIAKNVKNPINGATKTPGRHGCAEGGNGFIHSGGKCNHANVPEGNETG